MMQKCIGNMKYEIHHLIEITFHISSDHSKPFQAQQDTRTIILFILFSSNHLNYAKQCQYRSELTFMGCCIEVIINNIQIIRFHYH